MKKINNTKTAFELFEAAAIKQAESTEKGDYKTGNKCYNVITKSVNYLKEHNELHKLSKLLDHNSVGARLWAATYLLSIEEDQAIQVLQQIAKENNIHSFTAGTTLNEWEKGNLKS